LAEICEACGREITLGAWPFCPHEKGANGVIPDDIPGGMIVENGFDEPRRFDSHSAHRKALAAEGLEIRAKWAGPLDKYLTRWDTVNLEDAKALVMRGVEARLEKRKTHFPKATEPITVTDGETFRA
jgi:hypothetical protein